MTLLKKRMSRDIAADSPPLPPPPPASKKARTQAHQVPDFVQAQLMMRIRDQLHRLGNPQSSSWSTSPPNSKPAAAVSAPTSSTAIVVTPCMSSSPQPEEILSQAQGHDLVIAPSSSSTPQLPRPLPPLPFKKTGEPVVGQNPLDMLCRVAANEKSTALPKKKAHHVPQAQALKLKSCLKLQAQPRTNEENYLGCRSSSGLRHGRGIMKYPNGCRYVGHFSNDKRHGYGKVWYPNNLGVYTGNWRQNKRCGMGTMNFANGDIYEGQWMNDQPNGFGELVMKNNEIYSGDFVNRKKEGRGIYTWPNGDVYKGEFRIDVRHGPGVMISADGKVDRRYYYEGCLLQYGLP